MHQPVISGTGVFTPPEVITNEELVVAFNAYADLFNDQNKAAIEAGEIEAKAHSSVEFIVNASGIHQRYVMDKTGILDPEIMHQSAKSSGENRKQCGCGDHSGLQHGACLSGDCHRGAGIAGRAGVWL